MLSYLTSTQAFFNKSRIDSQGLTVSSRNSNGAVDAPTSEGGKRPDLQGT